ncbi:MAG: 3-isopropylmalate dehydratase large subunit [Candidatus Methanospirare jalkutatii]|nr:3-isopropylmalate dehydratase large subunit [Candidatus Methanospirare jalkutatii]
MGGKTIAEKILSAKASVERAEPGDILECEIDYVMVNDITGVPAFEVCEEIGAGMLNERVVVVQDHYVPAKDIPSAEQAKALREFALKYKTHYYEIGKGGICHQVMIEEGFVAPGRLIVGADSHTCSYGALGAFATGIGSTEAGVVFATGKLWFRVPETQKFVVEGSLRPFVCGKDVVLHILGEIGVAGSKYKAQEFYGSTIKKLPLSDRITIANMSVEAGAKTCIFPPDEKVFSFLKGRGRGEYEPVYADDDASYDEIFEFNAEEIVPMVAKPFSPDNVVPASELSDEEIDQAFIGSCTNGRIEDLRLAATILKGRKVHPSVRMIVVPASQSVFKQALRERLIEIFLEAGAFVCSATCGACLGGHLGVLAEGEKCISTTNRNFIGRMGHKNAEVFLASPAVVAASAVTGKITDPSHLLS